MRDEQHGFPRAEPLCFGHGERLQQAKVYLDTPELFAWTLVIVLMSVGFEKLCMAALGALERRLTRL